MAKKKKLLNAYQISRDDNWRSRTGHLPIKLTNDYLFRALIQSDPDTRNSIIASLLGISVDEILETTVENPILLGESLEDKYFFLDIRVIFNRSAVINLELQVSNEHNWPERSLGYLCRCFDNLNHGISYRDTKAAYQFGFLDFTLFKDEPKFFSRYKLQDTKTHRVYTDKFQLGVVDLTKIGLATEEDKKYILMNAIDCRSDLLRIPILRSLVIVYRQLKLLASINWICGPGCLRQKHGRSCVCLPQKIKP